MIQQGIPQPSSMAQTGPVQGGIVKTVSGQGGMVQGGMVQGGMVQGGMVQGGMIQGGMTQGGMTQGGMVQTGMPQTGMQQRPPFQSYQPQARLPNTQVNI